MGSRLNTDPGRYGEEGYCVLRGVVPGPALPRLREDILACIAEAKAKPAYANLETRHYRDFAAGLHLKKESVVESLRIPALRGLAGGLLGPDVDLRFTSTMTKTRERPSALDWHQDAVYDPEPDHPKFLIWMAVTDALPENGGGRILPGTHRNGLAKHILSRRRTSLGAPGDASLIPGFQIRNSNPSVGITVQPDSDTRFPPKSS